MHLNAGWEVRSDWWKTCKVQPIQKKFFVCAIFCTRCNQTCHDHFMTYWINLWSYMLSERQHPPRPQWKASCLRYVGQVAFLAGSLPARRQEKGYATDIHQWRHDLFLHSATIMIMHIACETGYNVYVNMLNEIRIIIWINVWLIIHVTYIFDS